MKKHIILFGIIVLVALAVVVVRKKAVDYTVEAIDEYTRPYFLTYEGKIKRDTCIFAACVIIPNAQIDFFGTPVLLGDVEVAVMPKSPISIKLSNHFTIINGNYLNGSIEISNDMINVEKADFALLPMTGNITGTTGKNNTQITANVTNFKNAFVQYMPTINPNVPVEMAALFSNDPVTLKFNQTDGWIMMDGIPLFKVK